MPKKIPTSITFPHSTVLWDRPLCSFARSPFRGLGCSLASFRSLPVYQWSLPWPLCLKLPSLEIFIFLRNCHIMHFTYMFCLPPFKLLQSKYFCLFDPLICFQRLRLWWAKYGPRPGQCSPAAARHAHLHTYCGWLLSRPDTAEQLPDRPYGGQHLQWPRTEATRRSLT